MEKNSLHSALSGQVLNILIVKPSSLGDIIHAFLAVSLIKKQYPDAKIDWLVHPAFAPILAYHPDVDRKITFPRQELGRLSSCIPAFISLVKELRKKRYDIVIDMQGLIRSSLFAFLAKSSGTYGFANPKEALAKLLYKKSIELPQSLSHAVDKNLYLVSEIIGIPYNPDATITMDIPVIEHNHKTLLKKLATEGVTENDICVGIIPGARWESKCWPPAFFADVALAIAREHKTVKFLIIGTKDDCDIADLIIAIAGTNAKIISFAGKTDIGELVEITRICSSVITNDSGPMHIAAALGVPCAALFGPTDPDKTGPFGKCHAIFQSDKPCIKCLKRYCPDDSYICHDINVNAVAKKIIEYLRSEK